MGINWIESRGRYGKQASDVEVSFIKGEIPQYSFRFTNGAMASKFKNAERLMVGFDDNCTRVYFATAESGLGYKVVKFKLTSTVRVTESKVNATLPTLNPSTVCGSYTLKYDEVEKLYYISIGALPR